MMSRIDQIKNSEDMLRIVSYGTREFTNKELKEALIDAQDSMMRATFEKTHADSLGRYDFYKYFYDSGKEYDLEGDLTYRRFIGNLNTVKNTICSLIHGEIGENRISKELRLVEMNGAKVLHNLQLKDGLYDCTEIDSIVIDGNGIHVIEVKNYKNDIKITQDGMLVEKNNRTYPLALKLNEKEYLIKKLLKDSGIDYPIPYESILVNANDKTTVVDEYHYIKLCSSGSVVQYLLRNQDRTISSDSVNTIEKILRSSHCEMRYGWTDVDFSQLVCDFSYVLASIESKSRAKDELECEKVSSKPFEAHWVNNTTNDFKKYIFGGIAGVLLATVCYTLSGE